jgi:hypothetical protein
LLNQSSDWSGTLFGLHDWADRPPKKVLTIGKTGNSMNQEPSLNIMMYVLTCSPILYCKFGKPLPVILKEKLWTPLVLTTWRWYGYENSFVNVDGSMMQSVSGGGHSGGGVFISAIDQARLVYYFKEKVSGKTSS